MKIKAMFAAILAVGLILFGAAAPASAHTASLSGVATCEEDGTYSVLWTGTLSNYGDHQDIDIKVIQRSPEVSLINGVAGQVWLYEWAEHSANHGLPNFPEGGVFTYEQTNIPGNAPSATTMYQFDFKDGPSGDPIATVVLDGDCTPAIPQCPEGQEAQPNGEGYLCGRVDPPSPEPSDPPVDIPVSTPELAPTGRDGVGDANLFFLVFGLLAVGGLIVGLRDEGRL